MVGVGVSRSADQRPGRSSAGLNRSGPVFEATEIVGIVVTVYFYNTMKREAAAWETAGTVSSRGVKFVAATSLVWSAVLIAGRLTAYLGTLYSC